MYFRNFCVCVTNPQRLNYTQILVAYPLWTLDCLCSASSSTTQILPFRDLVHVILTLQQHLPFSLPLLVLYLALLILILCQLICTTPSAGPPSSSSLSPGTIWFYLSIVLALLPIANGRNWLGTSKFHGQGDFMDNASRLFSFAPSNAQLSWGLLRFLFYLISSLYQVSTTGASILDKYSCGGFFIHKFHGPCGTFTRAILQPCDNISFSSLPNCPYFKHDERYKLLPNWKAFDLWWYR